jgi:hypothetical protein
LALGAAWAAFHLPAVSPRAAVLISALALSADIAGHLTGHPRPFSMHTQVPMQWASLFDLRTAATLYGARLGIGPLTPMLSWMWWAAVLIGASVGSWASALVGATFGALRMAIVVAAGLGVEPAMAQRMARLRRGERLVVPAICIAVPLGWVMFLRIW